MIIQCRTSARNETSALASTSYVTSTENNLKQLIRPLAHKCKNFFISVVWWQSVFDPTGEYLLTISHSGRGVFSSESWTRVARDASLAYPEAGLGVGIGPIEGKQVPVVEMPFELGRFTITSPDGRMILDCESDGITVHIHG